MKALALLLVLAGCSRCGPNLPPSPPPDAGECVPDQLAPDGGSLDGGYTDGCGRFLGDAPPSDRPDVPPEETP